MFHHAAKRLTFHEKQRIITTTKLKEMPQIMKQNTIKYRF